jgi:hypothetical protein
MGINPQVMGQIEPEQLNGTMEMAKEQSELIISSLFYEHDEVMTEALNMLVNIACKYSYTRETILNLVDDDMGIELIQIQNEILNNADYKFIMMDNRKEEADLKELKQMAFKQADKNLLPFEKWVDLYSIESVRELANKLKHYTEVSREMAQSSGQANMKQQLDFEKAKISFAKDYDMQAVKENSRLKEIELDLKKAELQLKQQEMDAKNQMEKYKVDKQSDDKRFDKSSEREVESAYLQEENRSNTAQEQLQAMKLELDSILGTVQYILKSNEIQIKKDSIQKKVHNQV